MPEKFVDWIYWKLGNKIAEDYMIPYNQKMFSKELNDLGTYWLEKLPNVSFEETMYSCLEKKAYGQQPGHAQFYYPKEYGYGELWRRMADRLGEHIIYNTEVESIDFDKKCVNDMYEADYIISTIPWTILKDIKGMPEDICKDIGELKHSAVEIKYCEENLDTQAQWIYYPNPALSYHRILVRHNFCQGSKGYWTETNKERIVENDNSYRYMNEYAYPLNTINKPAIMKKLLDWTATKHVYGLGRWGEWQHYNSDVTVERAMKLFEELP